MSTSALVSRIEVLESRLSELTDVIDELLAKNIPLHTLLGLRTDIGNMNATPVVVRFDDNCSIRNSYEAEHWNGKIFKWLGPNTISTIPVPVARSTPYLVTIDVLFVAPGLDLPKCCSVAVDGEPVPVEIARLDDGYLIKLVVPASERTDVAFPMFLLTLECSQCVRLSDADPRMASIAISQMEIMPVGAGRAIRSVGA